MTLKSFSRLAPALVLIGGALSGCSGTTYGTGVSPGAQTLDDILGIAKLSNDPKEKIDYKPRPPIVPPPETATLPPPGDPAATASTADWPNDPDVAARKRHEAQLARAENGDNPDPKFRLPHQSAQHEPWTPMDDKTNAEKAMTTPEQRANSMKLYADARAQRGGSVDANGVPIRKYLIEPPSAYREPDPNAPTEIVDKPKKSKSGFKWPWQWFQ